MHPLRPRIKPITDRTVNAPQPFVEADNGKFRPMPHLQVKALSESIHPGNPTVSADQVDAYPDVWARALLFEQALFNPGNPSQPDQTGHPMHKTVYGEWCGLLAMFALARQRNLHSFRGEALDLNDQALQHPFIRALRLMKPLHPPLHNLNPWEQLYVLNLSGVPIGLCSPQTLVCSATEYQILEPNLSWRSPESGRLISPVGHLRESEYADLLHWLHGLYAHLATLLGERLTLASADHARSLGDLLLQYAQELLDYLRRHASTPTLRQAAENAQQSAAESLYRLQSFVTQPGIKVSFEQNSPVNHERGQGVPRFRFLGIYAPFEQVVSPPKVSAVDSPLRILSGRSREHVLLLDEHLPRVLNQTPHQIMVYGTISLASLDMARLAQSGQDPRQLNGEQLVNARWKMAKDFFTERLFIIEGNPAEVMPGARQIEGVNSLRWLNNPVIPLLPLQEELLELFTIDELQTRLSFRQDGDKIQVSLRLPLAAGVDYTISRTYDDTQVDTIVFIPALDIWPNFSHPSISLYLSYFSSLGQVETSFYARPYVADAAIDYVRYNPNNELISESFDGKIETTDTQNKSVTLEICRVTSYPDAMLCYRQESGSARFIGLILIQPPAQISPQAHKKVLIGVDLGTSSTNAFVFDGNNYEPVVFESTDDTLFMSVVNPDVISHYDDFLPKPLGNYAEKAPLLTLFKGKYEPPQGRPLEAVLHGHVNFIKNFNAFNAREDNIHSDLKWGSNADPQSDKKRYLTPFLEQLCLQAAMKALQHKADLIEFRFSYPSAFSEIDRQAFQRAIDVSINKLKKYSPKISLQDQLLRESVASTYFFASGKAGASPQFQRGVVILDIGGGTTDISIIEGRDNEFRYLGSVRYAGRDLFLNTLLRHQDSLGELGIKASDLPVPRNGLGHGIQTWAYAQLEAQVKGREAQIMENLPGFFQNVQPLVNQMAIGVAGLFYYVGTLIQHLRAQNLYTAEEMPRFYVGGNGAKVFHWFNFGHYKPGSPYDPLFEAAFKHQPLARSAYAPEAELEIYPTPPQLGSKPEVAHGLIMNTGTLNLRIPNQLQSLTIPGEAYTLMGDVRPGDYSAWEALDRSEIEDLDTGRFDGAQLAEFLTIVNSCASSLGMDPLRIDKLRRDVVGDLQQEFNNLQSHISRNPKYRGTLRDEGALFIQELKFMLNYL